jgi:hypothetical protein
VATCGRAQQTLVGAMAADSYCGIERRNQLLHELPIANSQEHALS